MDKKMKIITLMPIKNEDWVLEYSLKNISSFSDHIIIADQNSTDNTLNICRKFEKVSVINNPNQGHDNTVRWLLLDEARKIPGENLILCIDADEIISPKAIGKIKEKIEQLGLKPGVGFSFPWIQIFGSKDNYRVDGVWKDNVKPIAFFDDRKINYKREYVINDHTSRIPTVHQTYRIDTYPLLHLQSLSKEKNAIKQVWYRCVEFIKNPKNSKRINNKYSITNTDKVILERTKTEWLEDVEPIKIDYNKENDWHYKEILGWINQYGIEFFEPIEIWGVDEFLQTFIRKTGRVPVINRYNPMIIRLNNLKNYFMNRYIR